MPIPKTPWRGSVHLDSVTPTLKMVTLSNFSMIKNIYYLTTISNYMKALKPFPPFKAFPHTYSEFKIHFFHNTKFLMCSVQPCMSTISGITYIKTVLSFLTGTVKHFVSNTLCRAAAHTTYSHFALFHDKQCPL
jgi:hypothetical protein